MQKNFWYIYNSFTKVLLVSKYTQSKDINMKNKLKKYYFKKIKKIKQITINILDWITI